MLQAASDTGRDHTNTPWTHERDAQRMCSGDTGKLGLFSDVAVMQESLVGRLLNSGM